MRFILSIPFLALAVLNSPAQSLDEQIRVATILAPLGTELATRVHISDRPDGARVIEVRLTNRSDSDTELTNTELTLPWVNPAGARLLLAAGATATGRWSPTLVVDPAKGGPEPVSGMYLLAQRQGGYSLAAFLSWQTFWSKLHYREGRLVITADGEGRRIRAGETVALEKVRLSEGTDWQDLLYDYADAIASELHLKSKPARPWVGWFTWDYYGRGFRVADVRGNVEALQKLLPEANLIQIDAGWWCERGDYGSVRTDLDPDGMRRFAAEFQARGLTAGLHLDGMRFSPDSVVAREHPEFFLHDDRGELLRERRSVNGQPLHLFMDYSHPGACAYMRDTLRRLRRDWGFGYFKIDFLRSGIAEDVRRDAFAEDSPRKIAPHDRGLTSVERFHRAMAAFREGMGGDAYFVGCSMPFGPTFGHVDALRTGPDIAPKFAAFQNQTEANAGSFYLHGKVVQMDSDYLVVRAKEDQDATRVKDRSKDGGVLTLHEAEVWADYVALCSGLSVASDNLMILRDERKDLVRFAAGLPACSRFVPLDYWQHAQTRSDAFQVLLSEAGRNVFLLLLNWGGEARAYTARGLPVESSVVRGDAEVAHDDPITRITLAARHAAILRLPASLNFDRARKTIQIE